MAYSRRGLGAVISPDGTDITYPSWCNWVPFADYTDACAPATPDQIAAMQKAQLAKIAASNPGAAAAGQTAGDVAVAGLANMNPADAAAYQVAIDHPTLTRLVGSNAANYLTGTDPNTGSPLAPGTQWLLYGGIAVLALVGLNLVRGAR